MAKTKIRLTESQLIQLINKSMISEQTSTGLDDATLKDVAKRIVDLMDGDVENSDVESIQEILQDEVFGNLSSRTGKCAYKQFDKFYTSKAAEEGGTGGYGSFVEDLKMVDIQTPSIKTELEELIKNEKNGYCKTVETPPPSSPASTAATQTSKFYCVESEPTYRAYGNSPNQYAEVDWQGGKLSFYLDGRDIGDGAPAGNNVLFEKGTKKWTTKGTCEEGGPGKKRGLVLQTWTAKTN